MGLRIKQTSAWDLTKNSTVKEKLETVQRDMAKNDGGPWKKP
jgi:hypothetical protein